MTRGATQAGPVGARARLRGLAAGVVLGALAVLVEPLAPAMAAGPSIMVFPAYGPPGTVIRVTGQGFCPPPCTSVTISVGTEQVAVDVPVSASGTFVRTVEVPGGLPGGDVPVLARQQTSSGAGVSARAVFRVTPGAPPPTRLPPPTAAPPVQPVPGVATSGGPASSTPATRSSAPASSSPQSSAGSPTATQPVASSPVAAKRGSGSATPWGWLVLAAALVVAGGAGAVIVARRRRT